MVAETEQDEGKLVRLPDGRTTRFPSDMSNAEIRSFIAERFPDAYADQPASKPAFPTGNERVVDQGVEELDLTTRRFLEETRGPSQSLRQAAERAQINIRPAEPPKVRPINALEQSARNFVVGTAGTPGAFVNLLSNVPFLGGLENRYGYQGAERAVSNIFGANTAVDPTTGQEVPYRSQNRAESAIEFAGELGPAALTGGALRTAMLRNPSRFGSNVLTTAREEAIPTGAGLASSQALYGAGSEPLITGGVMLGTGLLGPSANRFNAGAAESQIAARAPNPIEARGRLRYDEAERVSQIAREMGFPITPQEALKSEALAALAGSIALRPEGSEIVRRREIRRGDIESTDSDMSVLEVLRRYMDTRMLEGGRVERPVQESREAARRAVESARVQVNQEVEPLYEAARNLDDPAQRVPENAVQALYDQLEAAKAPYAAGSPGFRSIEQLQSRLEAGTDADGSPRLQTNAGALDLVYREINNRLSAAARDPQVAVDVDAGALMPFVGDLRALTELNPNIAQARQRRAELQEREVDGLVQNALYGLYPQGGNDLKKANVAIERLLNNDDLIEGDLRRTVTAMSGVDGGFAALEGVTRQYLQNAVEKAVRGTPTGPRYNPGSNLANAIQGRTRENMVELLSAMDRADTVAGRAPANRAEAFRNIMNVMDRTRFDRRVQPQGISDSELTGSGVQTQRRALAVLRPLMTVPAFLSGEFSRIRTAQQTRQNAAVIASALSDTSPRGIQKIREMARFGGASGYERGLFALADLLTVRAPLVNQGDYPGEEEDNGG